MNIYALELARLPNPSLKIFLRLAKTLRRDKPKQSNEVIEAATEDLDDEISVVNQALTARLIALNPQLQTSEVEFDHAVDGLWVLLRKLLEANTAYAHPGFDALPKELMLKAGLADQRELAQRSRELWQRLFAAEGTLFTKSKYMIQAESMAALLRLIEQEELAAELAAVVGPGMLRMLSTCQTHYEDMVSRRLSSQRGVDHNLNELRSSLRWAIVAYIQAVHSLYRPKQPESAELVLEALQPVITLRESLARAGGSEAEADFEGLVELELPEPQEALEAGDEGVEDEEGDEM